jgi:hypothetical protein
VGFEPKIPASERRKTVHALDRTATAIGPPLSPYDMFPRFTYYFALKMEANFTSGMHEIIYHKTWRHITGDTNPQNAYIYIQSLAPCLSHLSQKIQHA